MIQERGLTLPQYSSLLGPAITRFLEHKRALGIIYMTQAQQLANFDRFLSGRLDPGKPVISEELVREWHSQWTDQKMITRKGRLTVIRQLCQFLVVEEPRTFVPPVRFLGIGNSHYAPRILTRHEAKRFLEVALSLRPGRLSPLRGKVHGTFLAMLYLTGLRRGEGMGLTLSDVQLENGVLRIRRAKFGKDRLVPITEDVALMLRRLRSTIAQKFGPRWPSAPFFCGPFGGRVGDQCIRRSFWEILEKAGIPRFDLGKSLRIHDLRHAFAVHRLLRWYEAGADVTNKLPQLAVYMGHLHLESSQRYLHLTEEFAAEITRRHGERFGHLIKAK